MLTFRVLMKHNLESPFAMGMFGWVLITKLGSQSAGVRVPLPLNLFLFAMRLVAL